MAISDNGMVAGSILVGCCSHAALWDGSTVTDLGVLGGGTSLALGVNNAGQVVGWSTAPTYYHGFIWQSGTMSDLGSFGGAAFDQASAVNALGQVAGWSASALDGNVDHPYIWQNGVMTDLGGQGRAWGINEAGAVVGETYVGTTSFVAEATIWQNGTTTLLGTLQGDSGSRALSINSQGQVVGVSTPSGIVDAGSQRPFLWENGVMTELPALPAGLGGAAWAVDINDAGVVVGRSATPNGDHAVMWTRSVTNLPPSASPGGPYAGAEGALIAFDGSTSSDPEGAALTYDWDFGDGSPHGIDATPVHAFPDNGSYTVTLTVSDGTLSHSASTTVTTTNVAPTGEIMPPSGAIVPQGIVVLTLGNLVEPSPVDLATLQYRLNCGSGWGPIVTSPTTPAPSRPSGALRFASPSVTRTAVSPTTARRSTSSMSARASPFSRRPR